MAGRTPDDIPALWEMTLRSNPAGLDSSATFQPLRPNNILPQRPGTDEGTLRVKREVSVPAAVAAVSPPGYAIQSEVGRGGMGVIFRAKQDSLDRVVALKEIVIDHADAVSRFESEALITGRLEHPNIVPVYDLVSVQGGSLALSMKLVRGTVWSAMLHPATEAERETAAGHDFEARLRVLLSVTNAVAFAHSRGIVHLDLKPANVMVGEFGEVLLMDWGLAVLYVDAADEEPGKQRLPHKSSLASPCGTPSYMPPELALGLHELIGPRTDIYLLGSILHELLTGQPPHRGNDVMETLANAARGQPPIFASDVPTTLQDICRKAMAAKPPDRYATVAELQQALQRYLRNRESVTLSSAAVRGLESAERKAAEAMPGSEPALRNAVYARFADAFAAFRQALVMWPENVDAQRGAQKSARALASFALLHGDLGLAEAQLTRLDAAQPETKALATSIQEAQARRDAQVNAARRTRLGLFGALAALVVLLTGGAVLLHSQTARTEAAAALAESQLNRVKRLSDLKRIEELSAAADKLWPATPDKVPDLEAWLGSAHEVVANAPTHRRTLDELRAREGHRDAEGRWRFDDNATQWEHDTLATLVDRIGQFETGLVAEVTRRLEFARTVRSTSIDEHKAAWQKAIASIAASPRYNGLQITPQLGLVPLGEDRESGLWEFAHLETGIPPVRGADAKLAVNEASSVVLVLLPGGKFWMGASPKGRGDGTSANRDPEATAIDGPVHEVTLAPFFISKYEMTQAQWLRATGKNPSAYAIGQHQGDRTITGLHPVEQVSWEESSQVMTQLGLGLPTEAQWEYAARGGTTTIFWTGDDEHTLVGAANLADEYGKTHGGPASWSFIPWLDDGQLVHGPIGMYRANGYGLYDTAGNVWEWCQDRYGPYTLGVAPGTGERLVTDNAPRVFRGGGFRASTVHAKSADRYGLYAPDYRGFDVGLRPARDLEP